MAEFAGCGGSTPDPYLRRRAPSIAARISAVTGVAGTCHLDALSAAVGFFFLCARFAAVGFLLPTDSCFDSAALADGAFRSAARGPGRFRLRASRSGCFELIDCYA